MKEILFRGQLRRRGEKVRVGDGAPLPSVWVYGGANRPYEADSNHAIIYLFKMAENGKISGEMCPVHADTVTQYAGVKDAKGIRIFEGDYVEVYFKYTEDEKLIASRPKFEHINTVVFLDGAFGLVAGTLPDTEVVKFVPFCQLNGDATFLVVGNIFDGVLAADVRV